MVYLLPDEYFFALSLLMRILGGFGSSMLTVAMISALMKATSFEPTTVIVSDSGAFSAKNLPHQVLTKIPK